VTRRVRAIASDRMQSATHERTQGRALAGLSWIEVDLVNKVESRIYSRISWIGSHSERQRDGSHVLRRAFFVPRLSVIRDIWWRPGGLPWPGPRPDISSWVRDT
jgi:hypothetical protein